MEEAVEQQAESKVRRNPVVLRARSATRTARRAGGEAQLRAMQVKITAHRKVQSFWPATSVSAIFTVYIYWFTLSLIGVEHALMVASIAIMSNLIQELAHLLAMRQEGYAAHILFLPWLVVLMPADMEEFAKATRWQKAKIAAKGPTANVGLIISGLFIAAASNGQFTERFFGTTAGLAMIGPAEHSGLSQWIIRAQPLTWYMPDLTYFGIALASVNAGIVTMSLLPLPFLDGGKMLKSLLESVNHTHDRLILAVICVMIAIIAGPMMWLGHIHPYPPVAMVGSGWLFKKHAREAHNQTESMSSVQAIAAFIWWLALFAPSLTLFFMIPAAIKPENTAKAIEILSNLWRSFI